MTTKKSGLVKILYGVNSWREAINDIGNLMIENGLITEEYIDSMISNLEEFGPYIVIAPHLALAHASAKKGVLKTGYSVIRYESGVKFGNEFNDPVKVLIGFSAFDHNDHIDFIKNIANALENEDLMDVLFHGDEYEIEEILGKEGVN